MEISVFGNDMLLNSSRKVDYSINQMPEERMSVCPKSSY